MARNGRTTAAVATAAAPAPRAPVRTQSVLRKLGRHTQFAVALPIASEGQPGRMTRVGQFRGQRGVKADWQNDAFAYVETIEPVGYVVNLTANTVAACDLNVGYVEDDGTIVTSGAKAENPKARQALQALKGPRGGIYELMRRAGLLVTICGEFYLLGSNVPGQKNAIWWEALSPIEIKPSEVEAGVAKRDSSGVGSTTVDLPPDSYLSRVWRSDPKFSDRADCALRRCLDTCRELSMLTSMMEAVITSRLAAGLLLIPKTLTHQSPLQRQSQLQGNLPEEVEEEDNDFMDDLLEHLSAPVEDLKSAAAIVPLLVTGEADDLKEIRTIELGKDLDVYASQMRSEMIRRLAIGLDIPPEILEGKGGLNHWCVSEDTEILTADRGWVTHVQLDAGDVVLTLNHDTGLSQWQPVGTVARFDVEDLEVASIEGRLHSSLTTLNHRWPTIQRRHDNLRLPDGRPTTRALPPERIWTRSEKLNSGDRIVTAAPNADLPAEAKWEDALVELVAWYWTEGECRYRPGRDVPQVVITQSHDVNPDNVARIRRALTALYGPASDTLGRGGRGAASRQDTPMWREKRREGGRGSTEFRLNAAAAAPLVDIADRRIVDLGFVRQLTAAQLELFIDTSIRADGCTLKGGTRQLGQRDPARLDALDLAVVLSGRTASRYSYTTNGVEMTMLSFSDRTTCGLQGGLAEGRARYTGVVWCPTTPNRSWFARRNGTTYFTGNTGFAVDQDFLFKHVQPVGELIADGLTNSYFQPILEVMQGVPKEEAARYVLVFDTSPIAAQADESETAMRLWEAMVISDDTLVEKQGWDPEAVKPTEEELARRILLKVLLTRTPNVRLTDEAFKELGLKPEWFEWVSAPTDTAGFPTDAPPDDPDVKAQADQQPAGGQPGQVPGQGGNAPEDTQPGEIGGDKNRGDAESPMPDQQAAQAARSLLIERLRVMADSQRDRVLEIAGARINDKATRSRTFTKDFGRRPKIAIPALVDENDLRALRLTVDQLFGSSPWENLQVRAKAMIAHYLEDHCGMATHTAVRTAATAAAGMVLSIDEWVRCNLHLDVPYGPDGLRVGVDLIARHIPEPPAAPVPARPRLVAGAR